MATSSLNCRDCKHSFLRRRTYHLGCELRPIADRHAERQRYWPADQAADECVPTPKLIARLKEYLA